MCHLPLPLPKPSLFCIRASFSSLTICLCIISLVTVCFSTPQENKDRRWVSHLNTILWLANIFQLPRTVLSCSFWMSDYRASLLSFFWEYLSFGISPSFILLNAAFKYSLDCIFLLCLQCPPTIPFYLCVFWCSPWTCQDKSQTRKLMAVSSWQVATVPCLVISEIRDKVDKWQSAKHLLPHPSCAWAGYIPQMAVCTCTCFSLSSGM